MKSQEPLTLQMLQSQASKTMPEGSSVWLFGSRARGSQHQDSDWDILVLLDQPRVTEEDFARFGYPFVLLGWKHGADVTPQIYTMQEWEQRRNTPFYSNVEHDKKAIYGA